MEIVEFVETHQINCLLQLTDSLIIASRVMHEASERIFRPVMDFKVGYFSLFVN